MSNYFYLQANKTTENATLIEDIEKYSQREKVMIFVLQHPLTDQKYTYSYDNAIVVLCSKHKISVINLKEKKRSKFEEYFEDITEDVGFISDKYKYKSIIGRPRDWKNLIISRNISEISSAESLFETSKVTTEKDKKDIDLLISLFTGSINDVDRVGEDVPTTILDKIKRKIQLFDSDQTRFLYEKPSGKRITIQGLSGTGKTELLLHKLKDIYINQDNSRIYITCHNKILANNLRDRIPDFFNFMKVEQQIKWNERLWCTNAWGSYSKENSGLYSYICNYYGITFSGFSYGMSFHKACELAVNELKEIITLGEYKIGRYALSHIFIDESQDFTESFFELCELVSETNVYIAGDIFQNIFDDTISIDIRPDHLLGKCYRTDPKTLMFAHALGMGLFESTKLRWLEKKEWEDCGYTVEVEGENYILQREPLKRFEDLDEDFESITVSEYEYKDYVPAIIKIIKSIKEEHPSVTPDDIGIVFMDYNDNSAYEIADYLELIIERKFQWKVNKAYESKSKIPNTLFISNRNNVKGLEFPFVICYTKKITNSLSFRNSLYTMLTRSFIKSYLISQPDTISEDIYNGLKEIIEHKRMVITEPNNDEINEIRTAIITKEKSLSLYEKIQFILNELNIDFKHEKKVSEIVSVYELQDASIEEIKELVSAQQNFLK